MTVIYGHTFLTQHENSTEQITALQHAIRDSAQKLEEVLQERLRAEEEIMQCTRETERRVDLMMGKSGVVDMLQELGHLLQEERHLSEQLNSQDPEDRSQHNKLQQRSECVTKQVRSLTAKILEVKQCLAEAKTRDMAAQSLIPAPTSKSKRKQSKPK
ncbi:hypothetical protein E3U43_016612 [Larimichthys crocea]|uniref:Uncharacterized protein n=1 Tax=Larimichthys crocea TaxID=215358 RepID=A0ACD3QIB3_LARCR|nr:hypothetical protein E3U43_016612 [Larimichthys crocea]